MIDVWEIEETVRDIAHHCASERLATTDLRPGALTAWLGLQVRLLDLHDDGEQIPCRVYAFAFYSDAAEDREIASLACLECRAMSACARFALANSERWGVWGSVDTTSRPGFRSADIRAQLELITGGDRGIGQVVR